MKVVLLSVAAVVLAVGLWAFEPWRLFNDSVVHEAPPVDIAALETPAPGSGATARPTAPPTFPVGDFVDAEHDTSGTARIIELSDGRRFLRLENLDTSDGPDLHVWLSDAKPGGSWFKYDDGKHLKLGELKATRGDQNYEIPADADLSVFRSAVIWCDRFNVAFGAAPI